jgi:hypothetical protein
VSNGYILYNLQFHNIKLPFPCLPRKYDKGDHKNSTTKILYKASKTAVIEVSDEFGLQKLVTKVNTIVWLCPWDY